MRAYFFGNMYLSSIQQGIQAAHALHEMFIHFPTREQDGGEYLWEWASCHKTMVLLNAGYGDEIRNLVAFFNNHRNPYPWAEFHEEQASLDGALTTVGIVLPEKIYTTSKIVREWRPGRAQNWDNSPRNRIERAGSLTIFPENDLGIETDEEIRWHFNKWEFDLVERLNNYGLAR